MISAIKKYSVRNEARYKFQISLGRDPQTGKIIKTRRNGFKTRKEAELEYSRMKLAASRSSFAKRKSNILFKDVYKKWYQVYITEVEQSTYARTAGMFDNHILPEFGDKRIKTITTEQIQTAVNKWAKEVTYNYKRWYYYVVGVFDFAIKNEYLDDKKPAKLITLPKIPDKPGDKFENFWSKSELATFFSLIDQENQPEQYALFRLLAFSGMRRGELLALTWDDLNTSDCTVRINKTLTQGMKGKQIIQSPKTPKSRRTVILDSKTMDVLKHWRTTQKHRFMALGISTMRKEQLMFATRNNTYKALNCPGKWLATIIKDNNLTKITVHGFRHSHASAMFASGATIKEVQDRLGHEDAQTTLNIYTHITANQSKEAVNNLVKFLQI